MTNLQGKKILILGGNALSVDIVKQAKMLGVYTIVTDWNSIDVSIAKQYADEHWEISLMDYDTLTNKIKEEHINGIITGFTDSYLIPYYTLCERTGLPCYATLEQFQTTLDKALFKQICRDNDVPTVPEYDIATFDPATISEENSIIFKPVDNSGSRGICICRSAETYNEKLAYALSFSTKKQVVIEQYMDCDDVSFEYKIQDGEVFLSSICDREIYKTKEGGSVTSRLIYPSKYTDIYLRYVNHRVIKMFKNMGLSNGVLFMQAFVKGEQFYFYEMGYRLSGGRHYIFTDNQNGTNACRELIHFAITGKMSDDKLSERTNPKFKSICSQLSIICQSKKISDISGWDYIQSLPEVIDATTYYKLGEEIGPQGTTASIFARIHVVASDDVEMTRIINNIKDHLKVLDETGLNIVIQ